MVLWFINFDEGSKEMNINVILLATSLILLCFCAYTFYVLHKARKELTRKMSTMVEPNRPWERSTPLPEYRQNSVRYVPTPRRKEKSALDDGFLTNAAVSSVWENGSSSSSSYSSDCSSSDSGGSCGCD